MSKGRNLSKLEVSETGGLAASNLNSIVDAAPGALDTLNELAAALGDDANFASTVTNSLALKANQSTTYTKTETDTAVGTKVSKSGDTMSGELQINVSNNSTTIIAGEQVSNTSGTTDSRAGIMFRNYDNWGTAIWSRRTGSYDGELHLGTKSGSSGSVTADGITSRIKIDGEGRVALPYQPAFRAVKGNATAYTSGGEVTYNSAPLNRGSNFSASTGRFTAPIAGVYFFAFQGLTHDVTNYFYFEIVVNNTNGSTSIVGHLPVTDSGYMVLGASGTIALSAGDYVSVRQAYNGGAPYFEGRCAFSGYLIG